MALVCLLAAMPQCPDDNEINIYKETGCRRDALEESDYAGKAEEVQASLAYAVCSLTTPQKNRKNMNKYEHTKM